MNKLFSKVAALSVGLAMAIGVGVAVGSRSEARVQAAASTAFTGSSITFSSVSGIENGVQYSNWTGDEFSIKFGDGGNDGKYYTTGAGIRVYTNGYVEIAPASGRVMTKIEYTFSASSYMPSNGSYTLSDNSSLAISGTKATWSGNVNSSIKLTRDSGSNHWRIQTISVTSKVDEKTPTSITINNTKPMELNIDDSPVQLSVTKDPATISVSYSSSNTSVVTVSNTGLIIVAGAGTSTVKASFAGDDTYSASEDTIVVNVSAPEPAHVTNMSISQIVAATTSATPTVLYEFTGYVTAWDGTNTDGTQYGNFYIADEAGDTTNDALVYGANHNNVPTWNGAKYVFSNNRTFLTDELTSQIEIGTRISVVFMAFMYNNTKFEFQGSIVDIVPEAKVLDSISLSGDYPTSFEVGDTFSYEGLVVTAHYTNGGSADVDPTSVSTPDLSSLGKKTVTVSYTESEVTKQASYEITVSQKHTITFAAGEGSGSMDPVKVPHGDSYELPECTFTAPEGKVFAGWDVDGSVVTQIESVTKDYTATATWVEQTEWEAVMTPGTNGYAGTVNGKDAVKVGTGSAGGDMTVKVGAGATGLKFYAAAWKGVSGLSINISGATVNPVSVELTADDGFTGSGTAFTLAGDEDDYLFNVALSGIESETTLTFESSIAKRFVIWGAVYSKGEQPVPAALVSIAVSNVKTEYKIGDTFVKPTVTATYDDESTKDVSAQAQFEGFDSAAAHESQTITVTYSENEVEKSTSYTVSIAAPQMKTYRKVESELVDYSGKYLIVYEGDSTHASVALDSSLTTLDANGNGVAVTINEGVIQLAEGHEFTVSTTEGGYTLKSDSGYYIGQNTDANGLASSKTIEYVSTISVSDGAADIKSSGNAHMRYNSDSSALRFRYYKSSSYTSQKAVSLYRLVDAESFASLLMSETNASCAAYAGSDPTSASTTAYTNIWALVKPFFSSMTDAEKTILVETEAKESGTLLERAMSRYDHIVAKYGVENFMTERDISQSVRVGLAETATDNNTMIIIITIAAVSAFAFTSLLVIKKKKHN